MASFRFLLVALAALVILSTRTGPAWAQGPETIREGIAALSAGHLDAAADLFLRATKAPRMESIAFFNLGIVRARQNRNAESATAFERAAELATTDFARAQARYNRGVVLVQLGQLQDGLSEFAQALRLAPSDENARTNFAITRARLERDRARVTPPSTTPRPDEVRRALERVPDQSYDFANGTRVSRRLALEKDW